MPHQHEEAFTRESIMAKAQELAELISHSTEVDFYRKAEEQIANHKRVQDLISSIKKKQKEAVAFGQAFHNAGMVKKIDDEIGRLQDELASIPIVAEFQESQSELNDMLQLVIGALRDTVSNKISIGDQEGAQE